MVMLKSSNKCKTWKNVKDLTCNREFNQTFARRPVNVHPDSYAFWADGHARQHSESRLYFSDKKGNVFMLPEVMDKPFMKPIPVYQGEHKKTSSSLSKEFVDKQLSSAVSHYKILMDHAPETDRKSTRLNSSH